MDSSDDEVMETSSHNQSASEVLQQTYGAIKTQLQDNDDCLKLSVVSSTVDHVPDVSHAAHNQTTMGVGVNNPKLAMEDSDAFRDTCSAITKQLYGDAASALPSSIDDITALLLGSLGKSNGDELSEGKLAELIQLWQIDYKPVNESMPRVGTFEIAACALPHELTNAQFVQLRKKMNIKAFANQAERQKFVERVSRMGREEVNGHLTINRRNQKQEGGTKQNVEDNDGQAVVNRDEREQARILRTICSSFVNKHPDAESDPEPLSYWSFIMSDDYAETVENAFYMSFLVKLEIIQLWHSELFEDVVFVPVFETIDKSKFGTKSAQAHRKKDIAAYKQMSQHVRQASLKLLAEKQSIDDKLTKKSERHIERNGVPYAKASRQGVVNLTTKFWRKAVAQLRLTSTNAGTSWEKYIPTRPEN